jgi:NADH pyrophosphatase NudC (nudix superfamily)
VLIQPCPISKQTGKAVQILGQLWLPKSQTVIKDNYVFGISAWLLEKYSHFLEKSKYKTIEEVEFYEQMMEKMKTDKTLRQCKRCGCYFHDTMGEYHRLCTDCRNF